MKGSLHRLCAVVLLCATGAGCAASPTTSPPATRPATASPNPAPNQVPITVVRGPGGAACAVLDVSAGGGSPVPVIVDTGSTGLLLTAAAIGPQAQPTGQDYRGSFVETPFTATLVRARVGIGAGPTPMTTPQPILIGSLSSSATLAGLSRCGAIQGVIGIGVGGPGPGIARVLSPLLQMGPGLSDGYALALNDHTGSLSLGRPSVSASSVSLPLLPSHGTYPDGRQAYQRDVSLCWTIGATRACGLTNIDSGAPAHLIRPDFLPTLSNRARVPPGVPVAINTPDGRPLESFTTTAHPPPDTSVRTSPLFGATRANTGIGFFLVNTVGFDVSSGMAVITPNAR